MSDAPKDPRDKMNAGVLAESRLVNGLPGLGAFRVKPADGGEVPDFAAGQATAVAFEQDGEVLTRYYSVASAPEQREAFDFLVVDAKGTGKGLFALEPGAPVWFGSCAGKLTLERTDCRHLVLLGTGTGLAPYLSMLRHLKARAAAGQSVPVAVALFHGARRGAELAFREELEALAAEQPFRFFYLPCVSRADEEADFDAARTTAGRADEAAAQVLGLPSPGGDQRGVRFPEGFDAAALGAILPEDDTAIYLCGNPKMIDAFDAACDDTARKEHLVFERWW